MRILYGGSVKPDNASELMSQPDIDGGAGRRRQPRPGRFRGDRRSGGLAWRNCPCPRSPWSSSTAGASPSPGPATRSRSPTTPVFDRLWSEFPHTQLSAQGRDVGLPDGQMGNSEVGHLNLGAGRVVKQDLTRIDDAIADGELLRERGAARRLQACAQQPARPASPSRARLRRRRPLGLGAHRCALIELATQRRRPRRRRSTPSLDGRDTPPARRRGVRRRARALALPGGPGRRPSPAATTRWIATRAGSGPSSPTTRSSTPRACGRRARRRRSSAAYDAGRDRRVRQADGRRRVRRRGRAGDVAIFFNFRPDRARELTRALAEPDFDGFLAQRRPGRST